MSRAFVSDSDGQFEEEELPEIRNPLPPGARNYMTPQGAEALQGELRRLTEETRPELVEEISRLASGASNPERNAVLAGRRKLREIDQRIAYLTEMARSLEIIDPAKQPRGRVAFGATVTVSEEGRERSYQIVGVEESEPASGRVSWISPVAKALMAHHVGETVVLTLPERTMRLQILKIEYR